VAWEVCPSWLPGCIAAHRAHRGEARTEASACSTWRNAATDLGPAPGDPVEIGATLNLEGSLETGDRTTIETGLLPNTAALAGVERISMSTFVEGVAPTAQSTLRALTPAVMRVAVPEPGIRAHLWAGLALTTAAVRRRHRLRGSCLTVTWSTSSG
jgi:hypothetical protein